MPHIQQYKAVCTELESYGAKLIAVSKLKPAADIKQLYEMGQRDFGENRTQELCQKRIQLPEDICWHQIGHLQRNKIKSLLQQPVYIQSVDSVRLLQSLQQYADQQDIRVPVLLQVKIAQEDSKYGFDFHQLEEELQVNDWANSEHLRIEGLMGMATFTEDTKQIRNEFAQLRTYFERLRSYPFAGIPHFKELSMGMSSDYRIALDEGSTMVRIGSLLFGERS